jgi:hypothetical protein
MRSFAKSLLGFARTGALIGVAGGLFALVALPLHRAKLSQPPAISNQSEEEEEGQDGPYEALKWRRLSWRNPDGTIPKNALRNAQNDRDTKMALQAKMKLGGMAGTWTSVGPNNVGGRTNWIAINPQNTNQIFTATAGGGIWKSTNAGSSWSPVNDRFPSLGMGSVLIDPNNSSVVYGGFGEATWNADGLDAGGMYKSTDSGATFSLIPSTASFKDIGEIAVKPGDSNVILAATRGGLMRTTNGGSSWTSFQTSKGFYNVTFNPGNPNNAVASYLDLTNFSTNGAYYTLDAGATWTACAGTTVNSFYGRSVYGFSPAAPNVVYAIQGVSNGTANVYKSVDSGANFSLVANKNVNSTQHWYDNAVWVDPTNPNHLLMGALDIYRSTDGGATWTQIVYWANNYSDSNLPHADVHSIVGDPGYNGTTNRRVYVGCDGGMFVADDISAATTTSGWRGLNAGYVTTQPYGGAANATTGRVTAGLQDNGTQLTTLTSATASQVFGGDGGWVAIDSGNPNNVYGEYVYARIHRSTNNGATSASYIYSGLTDAQNGFANFISPFILSPTNTKTMWVGASNLWRTFDATAPAPTWTSVYSGTFDNVSAIAEAPSNANVLYTGDNSGRVYKSTDATAVSPTFTTLSGFPTGRYIGRIAISNTDANKVYVGFGSFNSGSVYKSLDGGSTWNNASGSGATGLPASPIHGLCVDPLNSDHVFAGTEVGLYESTDGGATWSTSAAGPNNSCIDEVNYVQGTTDKVLIATHGRGSWVYTPQAALPKVTALNNPATLVGGNNLPITVTLTGAAPAGFTINLTSDNSSVVPAANFTFPTGSTTASFALPTKGVDASTAVQLTAAGGGGSATNPVTINRASLLRVGLAPTTVTGSIRSIGTVYLDGAAGATSRTFTLSSNNSAVTVPASVTIPAQGSSAAFSANTVLVGSKQIALITAAGGGQSKQAALTVNPPQMTTLLLSKPNMIGGNINGVAVTIDVAAPAGGLVVTLNSTVPAANIPASVTIPAGAKTISQTFTPSGVDANVSGSLTATMGSSTKSLTFLLQKANLLSLAFNPLVVNGGTSSTGTLKLDGAAGPSGRVVTLTSGNAGVVVPASATIPAGARQVTFVATTNGVNADTAVTVTANGSPTRTAVLTVKKGLATSLTGAASIKGGSIINLSLKLSAKAGPSGTTFNLTTNTGSAVPPATVTVPAGATSVTVPVTTNSVTSATAATITATSASAGTVSWAFTVNP